MFFSLSSHFQISAASPPQPLNTSHITQNPAHPPLPDPRSMNQRHPCSFPFQRHSISFAQFKLSGSPDLDEDAVLGYVGRFGWLDWVRAGAWMTLLRGYFASHVCMRGEVFGVGADEIIVVMYVRSCMYIVKRTSFKTSTCICNPQT